MIRAAVTGLGAVSGFGRGAGALWSGLLDGRRAMKPHAQLGMLVATFDELPLDSPERAAHLALIAVEEALADAHQPPGGERLGVTLGTTLGGIGGWLSALCGKMTHPHRGRAGPGRAPRSLSPRPTGARGPVQINSVACASGNASRSKRRWT